MTTTNQEQPTPSLIVQNGRVHLSVAQRFLPPKREKARWLQALIHRENPDFLNDCCIRQEAAAQERTNAYRKGSTGTKTPAPLVGVVLGKQAAPDLYTAFFDVIKAGVIERHQSRAIREGMSFAGVKTGDRVMVTPHDFIDPLTLITREGNDTDLKAEAALMRLTRSRFEIARIHAGEEVKSKGEELAEKEKTFAHADVDLLGEALRRDIFEQEHIILPSGTNLRELRAALDGITDPFLRTRALDKMDRLDAVDDRERVYLHASGDPAFRTRKQALPEQWKPMTRTEDRWEPPLAEPSPVQASVNTKRPVQSTRIKVSRETYDQLLATIEHLKTRLEQLTSDMAVALQDGDISESSFYDETRDALMNVQHDLAQREANLLDVEIGDVSDTNIGCVFTLLLDGQERQVELTDDLPKIGHVSTSGPLGKQLLHAKPGDILTVTATATAIKPTTLMIPESTGTRVVHLERPTGVLKPLLPEMLTFYRAKQVPAQQLISTSKDIAVQVLSIVRPPPTTPRSSQDMLAEVSPC
ncbi:GreA/GreB family elongation factor [Deinococcus ruber]|uniref:Transcription elongation factor GreA/GreB N-terminal domain-containing protein n=1 Tax=Deinococcus ruber TaxID=1848197 RepID=A0A918F930_9DEIO|nr:hypothetical protein [Deinococcus ruber]GGR12817.1 hypothetical protein GCM10008957_27200 [Deinococcus ruber]